MENYVIGAIAALLTMFGFVPQIIKIYRTKSAKDVSIMTLIQFTAGVVLWIIYGINIKDFIIVMANVVTLVTLIIAIILYSHYNNINQI